MTEAKHTPGPWRVPDQTYRRHLTVETSDKIDVFDGMVACPGSGGSVSYTDTICTLGWQGTPEWEANARLIAAAPDLLEALERCLNFIENTESEMGDTLECGDKARAAIARAKGEA